MKWTVELIDGTDFHTYVGECSRGTDNPSLRQHQLQIQNID